MFGKPSVAPSWDKVQGDVVLGQFAGWLTPLLPPSRTDDLMSWPSLSGMRTFKQTISSPFEQMDGLAIYSCLCVRHLSEWPLSCLRRLARPLCHIHCVILVSDTRWEALKGWSAACGEAWGESQRWLIVCECKHLFSMLQMQHFNHLGSLQDGRANVLQTSFLWFQHTFLVKGVQFLQLNEPSKCSPNHSITWQQRNVTSSRRLAEVQSEHRSEEQNGLAGSLNEDFTYQRPTGIFYHVTTISSLGDRGIIEYACSRAKENCCVNVRGQRSEWLEITDRNQPLVATQGNICECATPPTLTQSSLY